MRRYRLEWSKKYNQLLGGTYASDGCLLRPLRHAAVVRGAQVSVQGRAAALGAKVNIDSEEGLGGIESLPGSNEGLAGGSPGCVGGIDPARVELERGAGQHLVGIGAGANAVCRLCQGQDGGLVEVRNADVAAGLTAVLVVNGSDLDPAVVDLAVGEVGDGKPEGLEGVGGVDDSVVGGAAVVLDLLQEDEIRGLESVDQLGGDGRQVGRRRAQVLDVEDAHCHAAAASRAGERGVARVERDGSSHADGSKGQDAVEAKSIGDDARDLGHLIAELGVGRVLGPVERGANQDGLRVGIDTEGRKAAAGISARGWPVACDPDVAIGVGAIESHRGPDGDKLAVEALPKVQPVLGRVQDWVHLGQAGGGVGSSKNVTIVEASVLLGRRGGRILANDQGRSGVARRQLPDVFGGGDLGQEQVLVVRPVLQHAAVESDKIAHGQVCADLAVIDVDGLRGQRVIVRLVRTEPDAIGALCKDNSSDVLDILVIERRNKLVAVDFGDGLGQRWGNKAGNKGHKGCGRSVCQHGDRGRQRETTSGCWRTSPPIQGYCRRAGDMAFY